MADHFYRGTWAEINLENIAFNISRMKERLSEKSDIIAVVKANAYGHGSIQVAKKALNSGAKALAVALLEEALKLRKANIKAPIIVLGWVSPKHASIAANHDITLTFFQKEWLKEAQLLPMDKKLQLHMKWDTGMGRVGIRTSQELEELVDELKKHQQFLLTGVYTHFATADSEDVTYFNEQKIRFEQYLELFKDLWPDPVAVHIGNSAASIRFPDEMHNFVRFGISMYGLYPSETVKAERKIELKQAFSLHSNLVHVKKVSAGSSISYGKTYTASEDEWIGTIPIGYGDGWIRKLQGYQVLIDGKYMPIIGRICMDNTMVRLDKEYKVGTMVTLIGQQQNERIDMDTVANYLDTINYEIPCMINSRVPRTYVDYQENLD